VQHITSLSRTSLHARATSVLLALAGAAFAAIGAESTKGSEALKSATQTAKDVAGTTGAKAPQTKLPAGDPCTVLPLSEVQKAFPGAKAGERSRRLEEYGTTECGWKGPNGQVVLAAQESYNSGTAKEDVQGMAMGFTDPLKPQSRRNVRVETFPSLGSEAAAFVEQADPKRGILSDGAILSLRRGQHTVWLMSSELPRRDRAAALKAFEELGRVAAKRLQ
jgi:hypothetical protein